MVYADPTGNPTIGYGHLVTPGERLSDAITQEQGWALMRSDIQTRVEPGLALIGAALSQNQVDAVGSFIFNVGVGDARRGTGFAGSTLLREINAGHFPAVPGEMQRWVYSAGVQLPGLESRRAAEAALFAR